MIVYFLPLFYLCICALLEKWLKPYRDCYGGLFLLILIFLIIMSGIRVDVGMDYSTYKEIFYDYNLLSQQREPGFVALVKMMRYLGLPFWSFCMIYSILTVSLIFRFVKNYSPFIFLSLLIYFAIGNFYFSSFNVMRQSLATAVFINCLSYIEDKSFIKYCSWMIVMGLFVHFSALALISLYFILGKCYTKTVRVMVIGGAFFMGMLVVTIIKYSPYAIYLSFTAYAQAVPITYYMILLFALITMIYSMSNNDWYKDNRIMVNINVIVLALLVLLFLNANNPLVMIFHRVLNYFNIVYIVIVPILISRIKIPSNRMIFIGGLAVTFTALCIWSILRNGVVNKLIPYNTIFNCANI